MHTLLNKNNCPVLVHFLPTRAEFMLNIDTYGEHQASNLANGGRRNIN